MTGPVVVVFNIRSPSLGSTRDVMFLCSLGGVMGKEREVLKNVLSLDIFLINRALPCDINITHYYT